MIHVFSSETDINICLGCLTPCEILQLISFIYIYESRTDRRSKKNNVNEVRKLIKKGANINNQKGVIKKE